MARSLIFSLVLAVAGIFLLLYVTLLLPPVQDFVRKEAETELCKFLGTGIKVGRIGIFPFNQIELFDVDLPSPDGKDCVSVEKIGAGIRIWRLIRHGEIEITYAEIIGLDCRLVKPAPDKPLNIQFLIDAFRSKDPGKPPAKFDLCIHSVVLRNSRFSYDKAWLPRKGDGSLFDPNHISVDGIRADIDIPRLSNNMFDVDLRSLSAHEMSGFSLEDLSFKARLTDTSLSLSDIRIQLPETLLRPSDIELSYDGYSDLFRSVKTGNHSLILSGDKLTLADFSSFVPQFSSFSKPLNISADISGNAEAVDVKDFLVSSPDGRLEIRLKGYAGSMLDMDRFHANVDRLNITVSSDEVEHLLAGVTSLPEKARGILLRAGRMAVEVSGKANSGKLDLEAAVESSAGDISIGGSLAYPRGGKMSAIADVDFSDFNFGMLLADSRLGKTSMHASGDITLYGKEVDGSAEVSVDYIEYNGTRLQSIALNASKHGKEAEALVESSDPYLNLKASATAVIDGRNTALKTTVDAIRICPGRFGISPSLSTYEISGFLDADIEGIDPDNVSGTVRLSDIAFLSDSKPSFRLKNLVADSYSDQDGSKTISIESDWVDATFRGEFEPTRIPGAFCSLLSRTVPAISGLLPGGSSTGQNMRFDIVVAPDNTLAEAFNLPVRLLTPVSIRGELTDSVGVASLEVDIPYLRQGKDKLVRSTRLSAAVDAQTGGSRIDFSTLMPGKKGDVSVALNVAGIRNDILSGIKWKFLREGIYDGTISLATTLRPAVKGQAFPGLDVVVNPSEVRVAGESWRIAPATVSYADRKIDVKNINIANGNQFVSIAGSASSSPEDSLRVEFAEFDLDYLFETLNINYVTFGGKATGKAVATSLFSKAPEAVTDGLTVDSLTYNGALLGDKAYLKGDWDNVRKRVGIYADIRNGGKRKAIVDGGVWVGADSLSFDFDTDKIDIRFLKPFMAAFTSDVEGCASGKAKLYGTFKDIDMTGRLFADTIRMKVDYTNTWYAGSDSVFLTPGRIDIPDFRVYDRYGRSAKVKGVVSHRYFHDPSFEFRLSDAKRLLAYDTDAKINPDWYGTVFVNGGATIKGAPGIVSVLVDVATAEGSTFTYALNDTEAAEEYNFLSFSDRRRDATKASVPDTVPEFVKQFRKQVIAEQSRPSIFSIDLRVSVNPQAKLIIIMDPRAGDRITARGAGAMQIAYNSETDNMDMYGKYTIEEGNYNFTLQDLIIRDFKINAGSSISFNGDPLNAVLDIAAAYRVNTNLTDLDKSFSTDRDLNRTNVPVDAILKVDGSLTSPEISYDIKLPTLTSDVERKVKSIISTDDLMSRQIIYLLALNRFYTPEYMQQTASGGEVASVASSTISSQISNILGQISDKWSIAPSFRSDKGDFSDTEVDLALSSRLLNNRLLINGNFGYRDRSTSQTTFVGDFDIEYLLNRSGNLRLKAYNHFNDQNYYLRSALTTQGLGIVYRRDFDNPFTFLMRRRNRTLFPKTDRNEVKSDSVDD